MRLSALAIGTDNQSPYDGPPRLNEAELETLLVQDYVQIAARTRFVPSLSSKQLVEPI